ncbi:MAG TPA: NADH-quinone oxidoreductase subunit C [Candidatus Binatia bacterium]|nr:NADH-quinone oxidoreductase subunit C [Candidatus Binatia bacterium]
MSGDTSQLEEIRRKLGGAVLDAQTVRGEDAIVMRPDGLVDSFRRLKEDPAPAFDFLSDITAVDYLGKKEPRFEVVYHLLSLGSGRRVRIKVPVAESAPEVDSLVSLWRAADWLEREVWDMFGIRFRGHPDLRRILLYEEFRGYPLRKDYPVNQRQPLVPERPLAGTFVDTRSDNKLIQLKQQLEQQKLAGADSKRG